MRSSSSQDQLIGTLLIIIGVVILLIFGSPLVLNIAMIVLGLYLVNKGLRLCRLPGLVQYLNRLLSYMY